MLATVHFIHLLTGVVWAGGTILFALGVYPVLARLPRAEAQALWGRLAPALGPIFGISAGLAMLFGLVRAWAGGGIAAFSDLWTAYGLWVLAALVLAIAEGALGGMQRARVERALADEAGFADFPRLCRIAGATSALLMTGIVLIMAILGLGLY